MSLEPPSRRARRRENVSRRKTYRRSPIFKARELRGRRPESERQFGRVDPCREARMARIDAEALAGLTSFCPSPCSDREKPSKVDGCRERAVRRTAEGERAPIATPARGPHELRRSGWGTARRSSAARYGPAESPAWDRDRPPLHCEEGSKRPNGERPASADLLARSRGWSHWSRRGVESATLRPRRRRPSRDRRSRSATKERRRQPSPRLSVRTFFACR